MNSKHENQNLTIYTTDSYQLESQQLKSCNIWLEGLIERGREKKKRTI